MELQQQVKAVSQSFRTLPHGADVEWVVGMGGWHPRKTGNVSYQAIVKTSMTSLD